MKRVFGTRNQQPKAPPPTVQDASSNLDTRGNTLDAKINNLDGQLVKLREQIQRTRPGPSQEAAKRRALQILKQKRMYEGQRDQLYSQQFNLDQVSFAAESVKDTVTTVQALKTAQKDLKKQMKAKEFNISKIEQMQDNMMDLLDQQREVQEALGQSYDVPDVDESELMDELDALEFDMAEEQEAVDTGKVPSYLSTPNEPALPTAPPPMSAGPNQAPPEMQQQDQQALDAYGLPVVPQRN
eukprot:g8009.t1